MSSSDKTPFSAPLFHGILAVYMPCSVLIPITLTAATVFPGYVSAAAIFICAVLTAVGASLVHSTLDARTEHRSTHLRTGIIFLIISWILSSFFRGDATFPRNLLPSAVQVTAAAASFYTWLETLSLRNVFAARSTLLATIGDKTGDALQRVMRDELTLTTEINSQMKTVSRRYLTQCAIAALIPAGCALAGFRLPFGVAVSYMFLASGALCVWSVMTLYRREQESAGEGVRIPAADRARKIAAAVACAAVASIFAFLLSSDSSLLPQSLIERFLAWLAGLLHIPTAMPVSGEILPAAPPEASYVMPNPADTIPAVTIIDLSGLFTWLKYGIFAAGAAAFVWFLIKPLFSTHTGGKKVLRGIGQWFIRFRDSVMGFFRALCSGGTRGTRRARDARVSEEDMRKREDAVRRSLSSRSAHKKREIEKSAAAFARLIVWAETNGYAVWNPQQAPAEFCAAAARLCPETGTLRDDIETCGALFEAILYAPDEGTDVSRTRKEGLERLVKHVTARTDSDAPRPGVGVTP